MEFNIVDRLESSECTEHNYENEIGFPDDDWWESILASNHADATRDRALPESTTAILGSVPPLSNSGSFSSTSHSSSHPYAGARSIHQTIESPTEFLPQFDAQSAHYHSKPNYEFSSSNLTDTLYYSPLRGISIESAGYTLSPDKATSSHQSFGIRRGFEQQPQTPLHSNAVRSYNEDRLDGYPSHSLGNTTTSNALSDSRADPVTSDEPAKPYFHYDEDCRYAHQTSVHKNVYEDALLPHSAGMSPLWPNEAQSLARPASGQGNTSPKDSSQVALSTACSTSANRILANDDSWKCDNCGRVLTTKGTRNRNRNKRRHRCPGTGPKYPCPVCPKLFNRGDTRLLHVRKGHPEIHSEPPRPRRRKALH